MIIELHKNILYDIASKQWQVRKFRESELEKR